MWILTVPIAIMAAIVHFFVSTLPTIIGGIIGAVLGIKERKKNQDISKKKISEQEERALLKEEVRREMLKEELRAEIKAENSAKSKSSIKKTKK